MIEFLAEFWAAFSNPENLIGHVAYVLLITSMLMRSMNWLRFLAILAGAVSAVYYWVLDDYVSMFWESLFSLVNLAQLALLQIENRRGSFSDEEKMFIKTCLVGIESAYARKLMKLGAWIEVHEGATLITQGTCPLHLKFLVSGGARIEKDGQLVGRVKAGDFLGEMSFLTRSKASASVIATEPTRYLAFERMALSEHLAKNQVVRHAIEASFNVNLVDKLTKTSASRVVPAAG